MKEQEVQQALRGHQKVLYAPCCELPEYPGVVREVSLKAFGPSKVQVTTRFGSYGMDPRGRRNVVVIAYELPSLEATLSWLQQELQIGVRSLSARCPELPDGYPQGDRASWGQAWRKFHRHYRKGLLFRAGARVRQAIAAN